jgi:glyoxylase-like metal-dependent hydrolase (beta-lactamase superfamily II)/predicted ester cyclase
MSAETAARRYFDALAARDPAAAAGCWAPHGVDHAGEEKLHGPAGVRAYWEELFAAIPDWDITVDDVVVQDDRAAVHWSATGTFAGAALGGIEPTGARVRMRGLDLLRVEDDLIVSNHAYTDAMSFARQIGMLPPAGSTQEQRLTGLFNARTRATQRLFIKEPERVADGVWLVRGDLGGGLAVYFIEEPGGGVVMYDAGSRAMARGLAAAGARLGGINRIVLGHAHVDHRGAASRIDAPVWCHVDEVADAEGDGGVHYQDLDDLPLRARHLYKHVLFPMWDGGPVEISGTLTEGDEVAGFRVVHCPGHAPGLIALYRESDGVCLSSDVVYMADSIKLQPVDAPVLPVHWWNHDHEQARASLRKLAELDPSVVWTGHYERPVTGDVRAQLEAAAARG